MVHAAARSAETDGRTDGGSACFSLSFGCGSAGGPDAPPFESCWEQSLSDCWPSTAMKKAELATLKRLGSTLGMSDREDQLKHLRLAQQQLRAEEDGARDDQARYEKMSSR